MSHAGVKIHDLDPSEITMSSERPSGQSSFTIPVETTRGPVVVVVGLVPVAAAGWVTVVVTTVICVVVRELLLAQTLLS